MNINTSRFGELEVPAEDIITFPLGILGFDKTSRYVILNDPATEPLRWLQSVDNKDLAFVIIDPLRFRSEYTLDLSDEDVLDLKLSAPEEAILYAIVVIPKDNPEKMTANLQGPIVINANLMRAKQVISTNSSHKLKHFILEEMKAMLATTQKRLGKLGVKLNRRESTTKSTDEEAR
ncbi:flagellar assembly protein FliW [bacterium]|jgi:flagellar assembly factor FliW|nr:flagellar assembly protein FliW [bacterium]